MKNVFDDKLKVGSLLEYKYRGILKVIEIKDKNFTVITNNGQKYEKNYKDISKILLPYKKEFNDKTTIITNKITWKECIKNTKKKKENLYKVEAEYLCKVLNKYDDKILEIVQKIKNNRDIVKDLTSSTQEEILEKMERKRENIRLGKVKDILCEDRKKPYYGRLDISTDEEENITIYIGEKDFKYNDINYVIDWRNVIARVFDQNNVTKVKFKGHTYIVKLKRS